MRIERLQVDEGFFDGLDIRFKPGLNVIIGARGVGKTSILQLIRYALRTEGVDQRRATHGEQHAEAILAGGRVSVTLLDDAGAKRVVTRSAADPADLPSALLPYEAPLALGQNELEGIGLDQRSRLRLIDTYAAIDANWDRADAGRLANSVESLTAQLQDLRLQRESLRQQELIRPKIQEEFESARAVEAELLNRAGADAGRLRKKLGEQVDRQVEIRRKIDALTSLGIWLTTLSDRSDSLARSLVEHFTDAPTPSHILAPHTSRLRKIAQSQSSISADIGALREQLEVEIAQSRHEYSRLDDEIRPLRLEFEAIEAGAAEAAQNTARVEQLLAGIDDGIARLKNLDKRSDSIEQDRRQILDVIDKNRELVWSKRREAVESLNARFHPRIRITLDHFGDRSDYIAALASALRGSGLQHNQLAEWLSERMSPQELVTSVEAGDAARLALIGELTSSRVEKMMNHLALSESLGTVLTSRIDDLAAFELLVGRDYRESEKLSTGQRCAVVLPILLADRHRILLMDQPEDHLDNAYLVENTIRTLVARSEHAQTIVATHNANVPVLGDARMVVGLESDGRRGYVRDSGALLDKPIIRLISDLMEGGRDAFARRAEFYRRSVD